MYTPLGMMFGACQHNVIRWFTKQDRKPMQQEEYGFCHVMCVRQ